jgi:hypothetical protein
VAAHLKICPDCRRELEEFTEVVSLYQAHPLPDPGLAFWQEFERDLHVKLAQVNQTPEPAPWRLRPPHYILGATVLAGILLLAVYLGPFTSPTSAPQTARLQEKTKVADRPLLKKAPRAPQATAAAPAPPSPAVTQPAAVAPAGKAEAPPVLFAKPKPTPPAEAEYSLAAGKLGTAGSMATGEERLWPHDDILSWDVDAVVADLSREEQEELKQRLESRR